MRFGLRQLLLFVALLSLLFAAMELADGPWSLVILGAAVLVGAHVLGNLIGTRLRDSAAVRRRHGAEAQQLPLHSHHSTPYAQALKEHQLRSNTCLAAFGWRRRWLRWFLIAGVMVGAAAGATIINFSLGTRVGWAGWIVGTISSGVLGFWVAFLASSFGSIARIAWRQAHDKGT